MGAEGTGPPAVEAEPWYGRLYLIGGNQWRSVAISGDQWQSAAISGNQRQSVAISGRRLVREVVLEELVALAALVPRVLDGVTLPVFLGLDLLRSEISRRSVEMRGETVETIGEIGGDEGRDRWRS